MIYKTSALSPRQREFLDAVLTRLDKRLRSQLHEIRELALFENGLPLPYDLEAERLVLAAVLDGRSVEVAAGDFYRPLNREIFVAVSAVGTELEDVARLMEANGCWSRVLREELEIIRDGTPFVLHIEEQARRVRALARQRELIGCMQRVDATLRLGLEVQGLERLRELAQEVQRGG